MPRRLREGGRYYAYIPDNLAGRPLFLDGRVAADVAEAERAITHLDLTANALTNTEALARLLLSAEAVASSHIEGLSVSAQRLLRVSADLDDGLPVSDPTAIDVVANVDAMNYALEDPAANVNVARILEVHRRLLENSRAATHAGIIRTEQNWIGGSDFTPIGAAFIPPPANQVRGLLDDFCVFCNEDTLPAVVQAAIAHAQFETIHPFADGNGRTGRALIYMVLRRRGLALRVTPPISLILATYSKDYVALLDGTRFVGAASSRQASEAMNRVLRDRLLTCRHGRRSLRATRKRDPSRLARADRNVASSLGCTDDRRTPTGNPNHHGNWTRSATGSDIPGRQQRDSGSCRGRNPGPHEKEWEQSNVRSKRDHRRLHVT